MGKDRYFIAYPVTVLIFYNKYSDFSTIPLYNTFPMYNYKEYFQLMHPSMSVFNNF